jgi:RNA polymerase sigma-70 factor, ECF subfamily
MKQQNKSKDRFLARVVLLHVAALRRFALKLCRNNFDADDLVSETMLKAYEGFSKLKDHGKTKQWLFRILYNQFVSQYRSNKKTVELRTGYDESGEEDSFSLFEEVGKSNFTDEGNPEKKFISKITKAAIQQAIDRLPDEFRTSLILCDVEDFSYVEIAAIVKTPVGTVRSRIARARVLLQKELWQYARELGIKRTKASRTKADDYVCTCGEEENETATISS